MPKLPVAYALPPGESAPLGVFRRLLLWFRRPIEVKEEKPALEVKEVSEAKEVKEEKPALEVKESFRPVFFSPHIHPAFYIPCEACSNSHCYSRLGMGMESEWIYIRSASDCSAPISFRLSSAQVNRGTMASRVNQGGEIIFWPK